MVGGVDTPGASRRLELEAGVVERGEGVGVTLPGRRGLLLVDALSESCDRLASSPLLRRNSSPPEATAGLTIPVSEGVAVDEPRD